MESTMQLDQAEADRQNATAYGASIFSQGFFFGDKRAYYRECYLKSDHWKNLRAKKLAVNPVCQRCGSDQRVDVHHLRYRQLYDVGLVDLLSLCRRCHDYEHAILEQDRQKTWNQRVSDAGQVLGCPAAHVEDLLGRMGITAINLVALVESGVLKFGLFKTAFGAYPVVWRRLAYLILCGKHRFTSGQHPPGCPAVYVTANERPNQ